MWAPSLLTLLESTCILPFRSVSFLPFRKGTFPFRTLPFVSWAGRWDGRPELAPPRQTTFTPGWHGGASCRKRGATHGTRRGRRRRDGGKDGRPRWEDARGSCTRPKRPKPSKQWYRRTQEGAKMAQPTPRIAWTSFSRSRRTHGRIGRCWNPSDARPPTRRRRSAPSDTNTTRKRPSCRPCRTKACLPCPCCEPRGHTQDVRLPCADRRSWPTSCPFEITWPCCTPTPRGPCTCRNTSSRTHLRHGKDPPMGKRPWFAWWESKEIWIRDRAKKRVAWRRRGTS